jgi:CRP-like cAMP-binding protein
LDPIHQEPLILRAGSPSQYVAWGRVFKVLIMHYIIEQENLDDATTLADTTAVTISQLVLAPHASSNGHLLQPVKALDPAADYKVRLEQTQDTILVRSAHLTLQRDAIVWTAREAELWQGMLSGVPIFTSLDELQTEHLMDSSSVRSYAPGEHIVCQGDVGTTFRIVLNGVCAVNVFQANTAMTQANTDMNTGHEREVATIKAGDYFGEATLNCRSGTGYCNASVVAKTQVRCLELRHESFREILGPECITHLEREMTIRVLRNMPLLSCLESSQYAQLFDACSMQEYSPGKNIVCQGEEGHTFYMIVSGMCNVVTSKGKAGRAGRADAAAMVTVGLTSGDYFGEVALIARGTRCASVVAKDHVQCLELQQEAFQRILGQEVMLSLERTMAIRILESMHVLKSLGKGEYNGLYDACNTRTYSPDTPIVEQGQAGDAFYVIVSGECAVIMPADHTHNAAREVASLEAGDFFGEAALLANSLSHAGNNTMSNTRNASVVAKTQVRCLELRHESFREILGPECITHLEREMTIRVLRNMPLLSCLESSQYAQLLDACHLQEYSPGKNIVCQGEEGHTFYMIVSGRVSVSAVEEGVGTSRELCSLKSGAFFGEMALMSNSGKQDSTFLVKEPTKCLELGRADFEHYFPDDSKRVQQQRGYYYHEFKARSGRKARQPSRTFTMAGRTEFFFQNYTPTQMEVLVSEDPEKRHLSGKKQGLSAGLLVTAGMEREVNFEARGEYKPQKFLVEPWVPSTMDEGVPRLIKLDTKGSRVYITVSTVSAEPVAARHRGESGDGGESGTNPGTKVILEHIACHSDRVLVVKYKQLGSVRTKLDGASSKLSKRNLKVMENKRHGVLEKLASEAKLKLEEAAETVAEAAAAEAAAKLAAEPEEKEEEREEEKDEKEEDDEEDEEEEEDEAKQAEETEERSRQKYSIESSGGGRSGVVGSVGTGSTIASCTSLEQWLEERNLSTLLDPLLELGAETVDDLQVLLDDAPTHSSIGHYTPLYTAMRRYAPLRATIHHYTPLCATIHHYAPLYATK